MQKFLEATGENRDAAVENALEQLGLERDDVSVEILERAKSGFLGISGISSDNRDIAAAAAKGDKRAQLAGDMLRYEIKKYIGGFAAAMNGLDAIIFTGGIGENAPEVRRDVCADMDFFGIKLDNAKNDEIKGKLCKISAPDSKVEVWVVPTNEELLIARDTLALISK